MAKRADTIMTPCILCGGERTPRGHGVVFDRQRWRAAEWGSLCLDCAYNTALKRNEAIRAGTPIEETYTMLVRAGEDVL